MPYGTNVTDLPFLWCHQDASRRWENTVPWRGSDGFYRPLGNRRQKQMTIYRRSDGAVVCQLYKTPVVTYNADGTVDVVPYPSKSTNDFASCLLPGIWPAFQHNMIGLAAPVDSPTRTFDIHYYKIGQHVTRWSQDTMMRLVPGVDRRWTISPDTPAPAVVMERVDVHATSKVLRERGYHDFAAWYKAACALTGWPDGPSGEGFNTRKREFTLNWRHSEQTKLLLECFSTREYWPELIQIAVQSHALQKIRLLLTQYTEVSVPYLDHFPRSDDRIVEPREQPNEKVRPSDL